MQHTYGYRNTKTNILWVGQVQMLDMLSDPSHPDNRGRLETFVNDQEHGKLDWERITDEDKWKELVSIYGSQQGITLDTKAAPVKQTVQPSSVARKTKATPAKKPKKPMIRTKAPVEAVAPTHEQAS